MTDPASRAPREAQERLAYLTLATVPGVGPVRLQVLRRHFGGWQGAVDASFSSLASIPGLSRACATAISQADRGAAGRLVEDVARLGGTVLLPGDPGFPAALQEIRDAPALLFALGDLDLLARPAVAIVGARRHTRYGAEVCARIAAAAGAAGLVVVSGMARGLDAVAHQATLDAGGASIGVLGNGFGVIYPAANRLLYDAMARGGLLLTEFPPGERPVAGSFQRRNRLISGLARVTVVIEAGAASGTLITARIAADQGRDVMAVPGPVTSAVSVGTNRLIRDGAIPFLELDDLWQRYPESKVLSAASEGPGGASSSVLQALRSGPTHLDDLVTRLSKPASDLLAMMSALEVQGLVTQDPPMTYRLADCHFAAAQ